MIAWPFIILALLGLGFAAGGSYYYEKHNECAEISENLQRMHHALETPNLSASDRFFLERWREELLQKRVEFCGE